ncbi:acyl-CoA synthetase [Prescottella equi]|uniref:AMP-binding enzyme n=1 Tax=Prescottella equi ATCC 33707 TaxID=525370 RepID=E9T572_RHOHA|nr:acyl-CoA synthetase [Prescottella equi]EGD22703.1 AMP-binding enzyme [Prescottella equi ATCC 33707]MBU4615135.1 acyl-CoA synthetase [Rhodococcus sp. GG48]
MYPGAHSLTFPDKPAVIHATTGEVVTFAELETRSIRFAHWLIAAGLRRGDHIAVVADNDPTVYELYWGALRCGLHITVVNNHLTPEEVGYIVDDCDATVLVVSAALADTVTGLREYTPRVGHRLAFGGPLAGYDDYRDAVAPFPDTPPERQPRGALMLYSSGTTGRPKGIVRPLPDREIAEPGDPLIGLLDRVYGVDTDTVYLSPAPVYHAAPLGYSASVQALGGTVVMMDRFDAEGALAAIEKYQVTHSQWVPTHFVRMLRLPVDVRGRYDLSSMRCAIHAAAPCPVEVKRAMIDWWGEIIVEYYSSTEGNGLTIIDSAEWLRKPGSVGRDGFIGTVHICDDAGAELPAGEIGTVFFERDDSQFEYYKDPAKTAATRHPGHPTWTAVGDLGHLDEDRFLFLSDRRSFLIISGGVNIYPQEVENCLAVHPVVRDVAVIGVPDPEMGESVRALVELEPDVEPGPDLADELIAFTRSRIARYKCPRSIQFVSELPRTPTGKLVKGAIAAATAGA